MPSGRGLGCRSNCWLLIVNNCYILPRAGSIEIFTITSVPSTSKSSPGDHALGRVNSAFEKTEITSGLLQVRCSFVGQMLCVKLNVQMLI